MSTLGPEGHCTSRFKRAMCFHVDRMWTSTSGGGVRCGMEICPAWSAVRKTNINTDGLDSVVIGYRDQ